jgi:D-glycero-alpha-D-manno-heptose-7-phosphate kinase
VEQNVIEVSVPVRICDLGGWTDTWFGGPGRVLHVAVKPGVVVRIDARPARGNDSVVLELENFGERYAVGSAASRVARHPLLEAAIDATPPPADLDVEIRVRSGVPAGCGTGTSAAVAVALMGGLAALRGEESRLRDIAYAAHQLEVDVVGAESGIQDQLCAACGGINFLEIEPYPQAVMQSLPAWDELSSLLTLIFLGRAHHSSGIHRQVIDNVGTDRSDVFARLRDAAVAGRDAVVAQDVEAFGHAMIANTEAQRSLHPELVGSDASKVIELAAAHGAVGWKVNGAGGDGGSVSILSASHEAKVALEQRVAAFDPRYEVIPIEISSSGLHVKGRV